MDVMCTSNSKFSTLRIVCVWGGPFCLNSHLCLQRTYFSRHQASLQDPWFLASAPPTRPRSCFRPPGTHATRRICTIWPVYVYQGPCCLAACTARCPERPTQPLWTYTLYPIFLTPRNRFVLAVFTFKLPTLHPACIPADQFFLRCISRNSGASRCVWPGI